mmetsp:Transcript_48680/g.95174  ORF Transcript_48680/g.95174 Transcript_48680/m.95174 type:complete len:493 (+) Transcript_48680:195-1673(+)
MPATFRRIARPAALVTETTLDSELEKAVDDASLTLYFINLVVLKASDLISTDMGFNNASDPYCVVTVGEISDRTETIKNDLNPVWNEKMSFFVPKKPEFLTFALFDDDSTKTFASKDDELGDVQFSIGHLFERGSAWDGELHLLNVEKGSLHIQVKCRVLRPFETEVTLDYTQRQLQGKEQEREATVLALDESEQLREEAIQELGATEQEVIRQAEQLAERQRVHQTELTAKETHLLDQAQIIEDKIQKYEEAQVALLETESKKKEAETKLTAAEKKVLETATLLEVKEKENAEALTHKEKKILAAADQLKQKERAYEEAQQRIQQIEGLKAEVDNELTSKEQIILQQAEELQQKEQEGKEALTSAEQKLLHQSKLLEAKDAAAQLAQQKQEEHEDRLTRLTQENQKKQDEIATLKKQHRAAEEQQRQEMTAVKQQNKITEEKKQQEMTALHKRNQELEEELREAKDELKELHDKKAQLMSGFCNSSGCVIN